MRPASPQYRVEALPRARAARIPEVRRQPQDGVIQEDQLLLTRSGQGGGDAKSLESVSRVPGGRERPARVGEDCRIGRSGGGGRRREREKQRGRRQRGRASSCAAQASSVRRSSPDRRVAMRPACDATVSGSSKGSRAYILPPGS